MAVIIAMSSVLAFSLSLLVFSCFSFGKAIVPFRRTILISLFLVLLGLYGCLRIAKQHQMAEQIAASDQNSHTIVGYTTEIGNESHFGSDTVTVTEIDGKTCRFHLSLLRTNLPPSTPYRYFTAEVTLGDQNSFTPYEKAENIVGSGEIVHLTPSEKRVKTPSSLFFSLGNRLQNCLHENLPKDSHALSDALLLGRRGNLSDTLKRDFRVLGISHLLSVSGMHLSILCAALLFLLRKVRASLWFDFWFAEVLSCSTAVYADSFPPFYVRH